MLPFELIRSLEAPLCKVVLVDWATPAVLVRAVADAALLAAALDPVETEDVTTVFVGADTPFNLAATLKGAAPLES
jgi:hypothetical protein